MVFLVLKKVHKIYLKKYTKMSLRSKLKLAMKPLSISITYDIRHWTNDWLSTRIPPSYESEVFCTRLRIDRIEMTSMVDSHPYCSGLSQVADCQQKSLTPLTYLVSIGGLLCLAFLFRWVFLTKISLNWLLTLTTQPSPSKLSDNPDC